MNKYTTVRRIKIVLISLISALFLMSAYTKFSGAPMMVEMFAKLNMSSYIIAAGLIELIIVLALICRKTRMIAVLLGTAYLGGAMVAEFSLGSAGLMPGISILILWTIQKLSSHGKGCGCGPCTTECTDCKDSVICPLHTGKKSCDCALGTCTH